MIYEIRTYRIAPRSLAEVEKRFGEAYEYRKKYSELFAFWHTEIGPLHEIVHVWPYKDLAERERIRSEAAKDPKWNPGIQEFIREMRSEIVVPFKFVPEVRGGKLGPIFELRYYTLKPRMLPEVAKAWEGALPERTKLSPLVLAGGVEFGRATASCTSGRTRAWISAPRCAPTRPSGASGRRRAAATASSRRRTRFSCPPRSPRSSSVTGRWDGAPHSCAARSSRRWSHAARRASSVVIVASSCAVSSGRVT